MNNQLITLGFSSEEEGLVLHIAFHAESHHGIRLAKHGPSLKSSGETWTSKMRKINRGRVQLCVDDYLPFQCKMLHGLQRKLQRAPFAFERQTPGVRKFSNCITEQGPFYFFKYLWMWPSEEIIRSSCMDNAGCNNSNHLPILTMML